MDIEAAVSELSEDRIKMISTLLEVENKQRQLVPLKPNRIQTGMLSTSTGRDVDVKPSQCGGTTIAIADFLLDNLLFSGTVSAVISYDEWVAQRQLLKAKRIYEALKQRIPSIPKLDHKAAHHLSFEDEERNFYSSFYIYSARSYTIGRGEAINNLLLDEFGFFPIGTPETIFASAVQRVPLLPHTKIRILSTANGEENEFHDIYTAARDGNKYGANVFSAHFYPWFIHEEYFMLPDSPFALAQDQCHPLKNITPMEVTIMQRILDDGQDIEMAMHRIRWRRYKQTEVMSLNRSGKTIFIFEQEYPEDDTTCFVSAGDMAHDPDAVTNKARHCFAAPYSMTVVNDENHTSAHVDVSEEPIEGQGYVLSIDPGKGKISEAVGHVWRFQESFYGKDDGGQDKWIPGVYTHCATISGWYDEWEMAKYCMDLGIKYNMAAIVPEDNLDLVSHLRGYPCLYYREELRDNTPTQVAGWQMTSATKAYMITEINRHLDEIECHDQRFWSQCRNVRRDRTVKTGIKIVGSDDHYDAGGIAIACRSAQPVQRGYVGSTGIAGAWDDSWGRE